MSVVAVLFRILMLLTMLVHSVFGCIWHHTHGDAGLPAGLACRQAGSVNHTVSGVRSFEKTCSKACSSHVSNSDRHDHSSLDPERSGRRPEIPCSPHGPGCNHSPCEFLISRPVHINRTQLSGDNAKLLIDDSVFSFGTLHGPENRITLIRQISPPHLSRSAPETCARLQVWRT